VQATNVAVNGVTAQLYAEATFASTNGFTLTNANNGFLLNSATFATGKVGEAFSFNGVSQHVRVRDAASLRVTSAITMEMWVNPANTNNNINLFAKWDAVVGINQRSYGLGILSGGQPYIALCSDGTAANSYSLVATNRVPTNQWTHIAATYDSTTAKIYINGVLNSTLSHGGGIFAGSDDLSIGGAVGGLSDGSVIVPFPGLIDEPSLYNRALTATEIQAIYNADAAGKCVEDTADCVERPANLVSWWRGEYDANDTVGANTFTAIAGDSLGRHDTNSVSVNLAATNSYIYDLNGNMLSNGRFGMDYDDENQLVRVTLTNTWKSEFTYDGKLRMRIRKEFTFRRNAERGQLMRLSYFRPGWLPRL
jgi:hypothetical protein